MADLASDALLLLDALEIGQAGRDDLLMPLSASEELAAGIPEAQLTVLEGVGHAFASESAERFKSVALEFLARVDRASA